VGYRALFRSVGSAIRQAEREERRRQRELEQQQKYMTKMQALEQAEHEVEVYENRLALLCSIHKQCEDTIDWEKMKAMPPLWNQNIVILKNRLHNKTLIILNPIYYINFLV
jgi:hypothetical protein